MAGCAKMASSSSSSKRPTKEQLRTTAMAQNLWWVKTMQQVVESRQGPMVQQSVALERERRAVAEARNEAQRQEEYCMQRAEDELRSLRRSSEDKVSELRSELASERRRPPLVLEGLRKGHQSLLGLVTRSTPSSPDGGHAEHHAQLEHELATLHAELEHLKAETAKFAAQNSALELQLAQAQQESSDQDADYWRHWALQERERDKKTLESLQAEYVVLADQHSALQEEMQRVKTSRPGLEGAPATLALSPVEERALACATPQQLWWMSTMQEALDSGSFDSEPALPTVADADDGETVARAVEEAKAEGARLAERLRSELLAEREARTQLEAERWRALLPKADEAIAVADHSAAAETHSEFLDQMGKRLAAVRSILEALEESCGEAATPLPSEGSWRRCARRSATAPRRCRAQRRRLRHPSAPTLPRRRTRTTRC